MVYLSTYIIIKNVIIFFNLDFPPLYLMSCIQFNIDTFKFYSV